MTGQHDDQALLPDESSGRVPEDSPDTVHKNYKNYSYDGIRTLLALCSARHDLDAHPPRAHEEVGSDLRARDGSHHLLEVWLHSG